MERKEFLQLFGVGATLLFAGCLGSCAVSQGPPSSATAPKPADDPALDLHLDLTDPAFAALQDPRWGFLYLSDGQIILAKTMDGKYLAVRSGCPHMGEQLRYLRRQDRFECPLHGSLFKSDGSLMLGPSPRSVRSYRVTRAGSVLHIEG